MMDKYYPSPEETEAAPSQTTPTPEELEPEQAEESSGNETTVPLRIFSGQTLTPGQTITLKVVRILDDEAVVAPEGEGKTEAEMPMEASMMQLEGMAE